MGVRSTPSCDSPDAIIPTHPASDAPDSRNVILLRKPSDARIGRFLDDQCSLPFSYSEVGASRDGVPPGYPVNQLRGRLGAGDVHAGGRSPPALEDVRNGMDQAMLARCPHHGGYCRGRIRPPLRALVTQRLSDRLSDRGGGFATEALRVRIRHAARSRRAGRVALHGRVGPCGRLGVIRDIRLRPPGPPAGQSGPPVRALGTETVRRRLPTGHGCGRQCLMFPGRWVTDIRGCASTS